MRKTSSGSVTHHAYILLLILFLLATSTCKEHESRHGVLELAPLLQDADVQTQTALIDFSDPASKSHFKNGWAMIQQQSSGKTQALMQTRKGTLSFHYLQPENTLMKIRCRLTGNDRKAVLLPVANVRKLTPQKISDVANVYEFLIPQSAMVQGENRLALLLKSKSNAELVVESIQFARQNKKDDVTKTSIVHSADGILAAVPADIALYFKVPAGAALHAEYGLSSSNGAASFIVQLENENGVARTLFSDDLSSGWISRNKGSQKISIRSFENQVVRIVFQTRALSKKNAPARVYWKNIKLQFPPEPAKQASKSPPIHLKHQKPNIFLYLMDALRADHLEPYGYKKPVSPEIIRFAREAVVFERAYAHASWTRPAVASIFTGLYPSTHGTLDRGDMLSRSILTLPKLIKSGGYKVYGFNAQPNIGETFGFNKDFDSYRLIANSTSETVFQQIRQSFTGTVQQPAFGYVHVIDTHRPYTPLPEFAPKSGDCRKEKDANQKISMDCARLMYDSMIRQSDTYFGAFLNLLKEKDIYEKSVVILTADHGESFMEHGTFGHGKSLYEQEIHVPLIVRFPQAQLAGKRITEPVQHVDLLPTILDIASVAKPNQLEGYSLLEILNGRQIARPVYAELTLDRQNDRAMLLDDYKLIAPAYNRGRIYKLFHLPSDPQELTDVGPKRTVRFGYMKTLLNQWMRAQEKKTHRTDQAIVDAETEEQLKNLGYLQ